MGPPDASHNGHPELSLTEWVVLAVLVEAPIHGFAIAKELRPDTDLGRILTVHRPLVYRALDRLVAAGLAEPHHTEPGAAGPARTLHQPTLTGRRAADAWLDRPVTRVRDLRMEFLAKLRLNQRRNRDLSHLVDAQRSALAGTWGGKAYNPESNVLTLAIADFGHTLTWLGITGMRVYDDLGSEVDVPPGAYLPLIGLDSGVDYWYSAAPAIPEPSTALLFGCGLVVAGLTRKSALRRRDS